MTIIRRILVKALERVAPATIGTRGDCLFLHNITVGKKLHRDLFRTLPITIIVIIPGLHTTNVDLLNIPIGDRAAAFLGCSVDRARALVVDFDLVLGSINIKFLDRVADQLPLFQLRKILKRALPTFVFGQG